MGAFGCGRNGYPVEQVIGAHPELDRGTPWRRAERGVRRAAHARRCLREAFGAPEPERPAPVVVAEGENDREGDDEDWRNVELPEGRHAALRMAAP